MRDISCDRRVARHPVDSLSLAWRLSTPASESSRAGAAVRDVALLEPLQLLGLGCCSAFLLRHCQRLRCH